VVLVVVLVADQVGLKINIMGENYGIRSR